MKIIKISKHNQGIIKAVRNKFPDSFIKYDKKYALFDSNKLILDPFRRSGIAY